MDEQNDKTLACRGVWIFGGATLVFLILYIFITDAILGSKKTNHLVSVGCAVAIWISSFPLFKGLIQRFWKDFRFLKSNGCLKELLKF